MLAETKKPLCADADTLRANMDICVYKHSVLGSTVVNTVLT